MTPFPKALAAYSVEGDGEPLAVLGCGRRTKDRWADPELLCADADGRLPWRPMAGVALCDPSLQRALDEADGTLAYARVKAAAGAEAQA